MYGHGLLVFHVYYNPNSFSLYYNTVNDTKESPRSCGAYRSNISGRQDERQIY